MLYQVAFSLKEPLLLTKNKDYIENYPIWIWWNLCQLWEGTLKLFKTSRVKLELSRSPQCPKRLFWGCDKCPGSEGRSPLSDLWSGYFYKPLLHCADISVIHLACHMFFSDKNTYNHHSLTFYLFSFIKSNLRLEEIK